jgi:hypothetical protein
MALTLGSGPFGEKSAGAFSFEVTAPRDHALYLEGSAKFDFPPPHHSLRRHKRGEETYQSVTTRNRLYSREF